MDKRQHSPEKSLRGARGGKLLILLLLLVSLCEAFVIFQEKRLTESIQAQSEKLLSDFLRQGSPASKAKGTDVALRNVEFCWSKQVCVTTPKLTATASPLKRGSGDVAFDDVTGYIVNVHNANAFISPKTLEGMFNESVFNYPGSTLRNLTVGIRKTGRANHVQLNGDLKYFFWIPFEMDTNLGVDPKTNTLLITVNTLRVFGVIPATWLIDLKPFNLDKLLTIPENKHLSVYRNVMMVKPFGLFPPPRINGKMSDIQVTSNLIRLTFTGSDPAFQALPESGNVISLRRGNARFGNVKLLDTWVDVFDAQAGDPFRFNFPAYLQYLPKSAIQFKEGSGIVLKMPDHRL